MNRLQVNIGQCNKLTLVSSLNYEPFRGRSGHASPFH